MDSQKHGKLTIQLSYGFKFLSAVSSLANLQRVSSAAARLVVQGSACSGLLRIRSYSVWIFCSSAVNIHNICSDGTIEDVSISMENSLCEY